MSASAQPVIKEFFDPDTFTLTYVVHDPDTAQAVIIDSVLDYDPKSGRTSTASADAVITHVQENGLTVEWILETHVHADHLSAAPYLRQRLGGKIGIGEMVKTVQTVFKDVFNAEDAFRTDGCQFDRLFADGETIPVGGMTMSIMHTPGHTPACISIVIGDAVFVGDTLFMPDFGTARCDFPGGNAAELYQSIQRLLALPAETRLFMCHDYMPGGRELKWVSTVAEQKAGNKHVRDGVDQTAFVEMRTTRDGELDMPDLILPSVQVNMRAGDMPPAEDNGVTYLKIPVNAL